MLEELGIANQTRVNCPPHSARTAKTYIHIKKMNVETIVKDNMYYLTENYPLLQLMQGLRFLT